jgi:hypothetical protein
LVAMSLKASCCQSSTQNESLCLRGDIGANLEGIPEGILLSSGLCGWVALF